MNKAGLDLLKNFEGWRSAAYLDVVGVPTIGYGFTKGVKLGDRMTPEEGEKRLKEEVAAFEDAVRKACTRTPTENELGALVCFAYNVGINAFRGSSPLRLHNVGAKKAAGDALLLWSKAGGKTVSGLLRRREAERALYLTP